MPNRTIDKKPKTLGKRVITGEFPSQIMTDHIRITKVDKKILNLMKLHWEWDSLGIVVHYLISYLHWNTDYADSKRTGDVHECMAHELLRAIEECEEDD